VAHPFLFEERFMNAEERAARVMELLALVSRKHGSAEKVRTE
jgi:hypothetical protein